MFFIDTSVFVSRSTPLVVTGPELPFVEASPKRLLRPDQQLSYKRHLLELFSEQQDLAKKGLPAQVILEEDILSLVTLECGEKLEVIELQVHAVVKESSVSAQEDRNPFRVLVEKDNAFALAPAAPKDLAPVHRPRNPFLPVNCKENVAGRAQNPFAKLCDGKENMAHAQSKHAPALGRARNPFRVVKENAINGVLPPHKRNPFRDLNDKGIVHCDLQIPPLPTPLVPELSKLSLARFDFHERLGQGGQGAVYLVKPKGGDIHYALKVIAKDGSESHETSVVLERKILESNRESGGCLVDLVGAFHDFRAFYFVMPFCAGGDLDSLMWDQPGHRFPVDVAQFYAAEIVWGMLALHRAKYLHRDLKLLNVFIKEDGHIAIGDFGLAVPFEADHTPVQAGYWCGTSTHIAPETWQGKGWTTAADWWSIGVIVYHMLHGQTPWNPSSTDHKAMSTVVCNTDPVYSRGLDPTAQRLLEGLLRKNPNARFGFYQVAMDPFFAPTPWTSVSSGTLSPPFFPRVQEEVTILPLEDTPKDAAPYSFLDPHPHFGFVSPELEEAMARVSSTAGPLSTSADNDPSCKPIVSKSSSTVVHTVTPSPTPSASRDTFGYSDIKQMKNMTKKVSDSGSSSRTTTRPSFVDGDLTGVEKQACQVLPTVEIVQAQVQAQDPSLPPRKRWEQLKHEWTKFRGQQVFQKGFRC